MIDVVAEEISFDDRCRRFVLYIERLVRIFCSSSSSRNSTELFMNIIHFVIVWRERRHLLTRLKVWRNAFRLFSRSKCRHRLHDTVQTKKKKQDLKKMRGFSLSMLVIYARATSRFLVLVSWYRIESYIISHTRSELNNQLIWRINDCSIIEGTRINLVCLMSRSRLLFLKILILSR